MNHWPSFPDREAMTKIRIASIAACVAALVACGGKSVDTTIPLDDARLLNSEVSATYVRTINLLEETSAKVDGIGMFPPEVDPADVDTDLLRHVLEACFTEPVRMVADANTDQIPHGADAEVGPEHAPLTRRPPVGRIEACNPARMLALESYLPVVPEETQGYIVDRVLTIDILRADLKDVLVVQLDDLERTTASAENELMRLRETAAERRALAQTADLSEEDRRQTEVDYETITQELDTVEEILGQIDDELSDWRRLRRALVDRTAANIAALGTQ